MKNINPEESFSAINQKLEIQPEIPSNILEIDLRRNKLKSVSFENNDKIKFLDISDNIIKSLDSLNNLNNLEILDASYNVLTCIPLLNLSSIQEIYLISNDIEKIENINFNNLKKLDLAGNAIEKIENINSTSLQELYLSSNKIDKIQNLMSLKNLKILDLQFNQLKEVDCAHLPPSLEILLLQNNPSLKIIKGVHLLKNLKMIGIKNSQIEDLEVKENVEIC